MVTFVKACPYCRSKGLEHAGATGTRTGGEVTNYYCRKCGKTFPPFMLIEIDDRMAK